MIKEVWDSMGERIQRFDTLIDTRKDKKNTNRHMMILNATGLSKHFVLIAKNGSYKYVTPEQLTKHFVILKTNQPFNIKES